MTQTYGPGRLLVLSTSHSSLTLMVSGPVCAGLICATMPSVTKQMHSNKQDAKQNPNPVFYQPLHNTHLIFNQNSLPTILLTHGALPPLPQYLKTLHLVFVRSRPPHSLQASISIFISCRSKRHRVPLLIHEQAF